MSDQFFTYRHVLDRFRSGVLGEIVDDVAAYLGERGHSPGGFAHPGSALRCRAGDRLLAFLVRL